MIHDPQTTHRMLAEIVVIEGESQDRFLTLAAALYDEFQPQTVFEESLIGEMTTALWRRMRIWSMEKAGMEQAMRLRAERPHPTEDPATRSYSAFRAIADNSRTLELMNRFDSRYEREYLRAHRRFLEVRDRRTPPAIQPAQPVSSSDCPAPLPEQAPVPAAPLPHPENRNIAERTQQVTANTASRPGDPSQKPHHPRVSPLSPNFAPIHFLPHRAAHAR
jgi:hypothetical protein